MKIRYYIRYGNTFVGRLHGKWLSGEPVYYGKKTYEKSVIPGNVGNYMFFLEKIRIYDMTGLFFLTRKVKKSASVQVLPQLDNIQVRVTERVRNFYGDADVYDDFHPGEDSSQIFDVREYRAGDKMQRIHWKLSAKSDELIVKEHSLPKACPVVLFLDYDGRKKTDTFENARVISDFEEFTNGCDIIVANRIDDMLKQVEEKVYTRDIYFRD